jgi:apolipoprotein N-acyltransferase
VALLAPLAFTIYTLVETQPVQGAGANGPRVRIVQPSVPQREKWNPVHTRRIFDDHLALTVTAANGQSDGARAVDLVVWPEAAMPFLPLNSEIALNELGQVLRSAPDGTTLLAGALRAEAGVNGADRRVYNSLLGFQSGAPARVAAIYDKIHLVPFGEYLPLQRILEGIGLQQLTRLRGGFTPGPSPRPLLSVERVGSVLPLVCYEVIFPRQLIQGPMRPRVMINVTNDGWFGNTTGPRQHLHMAQVRAAEEGIPILRSANNGISAVIDGQGQIRARLDLDVRGTIDAVLPPQLAPPLYARMGDLFFWLALFLGSFLLFRNSFADSEKQSP